jgi:pimeloyl-ACP methyl ester carboxylesterase
MEFFATCNGIPVHISDSRKGDRTVIMLHGYLETFYIWEEFISLIEKHFRVITLDLPGHGLTGSHKEINSLEFSADVVNEVLDRCNVAKAAIAGHSMGGYIALEAVKKYPGRFTSLVLMHSLPNSDSEQKKEERNREIELIKAAKLMTLVKRSVPKMYSVENLRKFDEKIRETEELAQTHDPGGIIASLEGMKARPDNTKFLADSKIPALLFFGEKDNYILPEKAKATASSLPGKKVVFLENSGHNGFIEEPSVVSEIFIKFLGENLE